MEDHEKQALDELKQAVAELGQGVKDMREGLVDEETVTRIATEVAERQIQANPALVRQGYTPGEEYDDENGGTPVVHQKVPAQGIDRLIALQSMTPHELDRHARRARVDKGDVLEFQAACDNVAFMKVLCEVGTFQHLPRDVRETRYFEEEFKPWVQAMDSTTATEGDEFVPTLLSGSLIDRINLALRVPALFPDIPMPSQPWEVPGRAVARQRGGTKAEETADTGQAKFLAVTPATRKVTMSATKLGMRALFSKDLEEDSLIAILPFVQSELVDFMAADLEDAIINGDSTNPHQDSDVTDFTDPQDPRTAWNGLRNITQAAAKTDAANAAATVANSLRVNRKVMGKYGINPADLAHLIGMKTYINLLGDTNVYTVDKYGAGATILSGELGRADGTPLIVSEYVRQDLNATGVYDGVTTNRSIVQTVNRRGYALGSRRGLTVQIFRELYAESDQDAVQVSWRKAFTPWYPIATELATAQTYNVAG